MVQGPRGHLEFGVKEYVYIASVLFATIGFGSRASFQAGHMVSQAEALQRQMAEVQTAMIDNRSALDRIGREMQKNDKRISQIESLFWIRKPQRSTPKEPPLVEPEE